MKTAKLHILVDSREPSVSFAKSFYEKSGKPTLGIVEHIREKTFTERFAVLLHTCRPVDKILISVHCVAKKYFDEARQLLLDSGLTAKNITLASYECQPNLAEYCTGAGICFQANHFKCRTLSKEDTGSSKPAKSAITSTQGYKQQELSRIRAQYRLMLAIISRTESLGDVSRQIILGQAAPGDNKKNEYTRAIRFFSLGEPDMAGGSYSCNKQQKTNPIDTLRQKVNMIAATNFNVLIHGDSGSGKEAMAWAIHELSDRRDRPFLTINCAGLSDELLESELFGYLKGAHNQAHEEHLGLLDGVNGGTLFFDELPEMSPRIQAKLLRFIESGEFRPLGSNQNRYTDARIIAAGQPHLLNNRERLRPDLKSRVCQLEMEIKSLKTLEQEAPGTIIRIASILLERYIWTTVYRNNQTYELTPRDIQKYQERILSPDIAAKISQHNWSNSNTRDLNNFLRQWLVFGDDQLNSLDDNLPSPALAETPNLSNMGLEDDRLCDYLFVPRNRQELKTLCARKPLSDLKNAYVRHLFKVYTRVVEDENQECGRKNRPTQKELAQLMGLTENTLCRYRK